MNRDNIEEIQKFDKVKLFSKHEQFNELLQFAFMLFHNL